MNGRDDRFRFFRDLLQLTFHLPALAAFGGQFIAQGPKFGFNFVNTMLGGLTLFCHRGQFFA